MVEENLVNNFRKRVKHEKKVKNHWSTRFKTPIKSRCWNRVGRLNLYFMLFPQLIRR